MDDTVIDDWHTLKVRWLRAWTRADRAETTFYTYAVDVGNYIKWCRDEGHDILSLLSADEYVGHRERSSKYGGRNAARAIKAFGKYLADLYEEPDPFQRLKVPKTPAPTKTPTGSDEDLKKLLATCESDWQGQRDRCIILMMAHTGMRRGEVANVAPEDLDLATQRLVIPKTKTKSPRTVWLHDELVDALLRYKRVNPDREFQWPSYVKGRAITAAGIGQMLSRREKQAGVKLGAHAWRRKFAGDWLSKGGTETGLMATAGWTSTKMVAHYAKSVAQKNAQAEQERLFG